MVYSNYVMFQAIGTGKYAELANEVAGLGLLRTSLVTSGLAVLIAAVIHRDAVTTASDAPAVAGTDRSPS